VHERRAVLVAHPEAAVARVDGDRLAVDAVRIGRLGRDAVGRVGDLVLGRGLLIGAAVGRQAGGRALVGGGDLRQAGDLVRRAADRRARRIGGAGLEVQRDARQHAQRPGVIEV
jgi:hypothetical protein